MSRGSHHVFSQPSEWSSRQSSWKDPGAAAVEGREVDELGRRAGQSGAFGGGEIVPAGSNSLEAGRVDHCLILISRRAVVQDRLVSRIARVEAWPVNVPLEATYLMASGVVPGISRTVLRVTTDDGVVGLGEATSPTDAASLNGELGQGFVGRETAELLAELGGIEPPPVEHRSDAKVLIRNPLAGIEIALWDIAAKEQSVPLHDLLGGAVRTRVEFSEYFAYRPGLEDSPADVAAFCARMVEEHDSPVFEGKVAVHPVEEDVGLVRAVRAAIGPDRDAATRREHGLAAGDRTSCARAPRAFRHRERRGARRILRGAR